MRKTTNGKIAGYRGVMCNSRLKHLLLMISVSLSLPVIASSEYIFILLDENKLPSECRKLAKVSYSLTVNADSPLQNKSLGELWKRAIQGLESEVEKAEGNALIVKSRESRDYSGGKFTLHTKGMAYECT